MEHVVNPFETLLFLSRHLSEIGVIALINCPYDEGENPCNLPLTFPVLGKLWPQTLDYVGLIPVKNCSHVYKKIVF